MAQMHFLLFTYRCSTYHSMCFATQICFVNLLESCLAVLIECINDLEHDKRRAQINDTVRKELWQRAEKSQAALFFSPSTSTHVVSVSYQRAQMLTGRNPVLETEHLHACKKLTHANTRAYCSPRIALKEINIYCTVTEAVLQLLISGCTPRSAFKSQQRWCVNML